MFTIDNFEQMNFQQIDEMCSVLKKISRTTHWEILKVLYINYIMHKNINGDSTTNEQYMTREKLKNNIYEFRKSSGIDIKTTINSKDLKFLEDLNLIEVIHTHEKLYRIKAEMFLEIDRLLDNAKKTVLLYKNY